MNGGAPLDGFLPAPAHRTRFGTNVNASVEGTWAAALAITPGELPLTRTLSALRSAPAGLLRSGHGGPAEAPHRAIVEQFVAAGFEVLQEDPPQLLIVGVAAQPWRLGGGERVRLAGPEAFRAFDEPGHVRIALSFELTRRRDGTTRLATETRVAPTDLAATRAFGRYSARHPLGGAGIRLELLRGIRRRAERAAA